ncbi:MAG: cation:proton antiporter, partial [Elusimicrobia bacterium]|nr:cation:proton antiporter [Elusimicrobiota bacterium]
MASFDLSAHFFLQLAVIIAVCRAASSLGRRALQPPVVCEMVAGVLLGPSLFGLLCPGGFAAVFPRETMPILFVVSQVGLALYMFVVGLEFRTDLLLSSWRSSAAVSLAGIAAPMALGGLLGAHLAADPAYFGAGVKDWQAMVFTGAAMSITAFPMLARIIVERGLSGTRIGTLSLGAGAFDDVTAWCLLAAILAIFEADNRIAVLALAGGTAFTLFVFFAVRPVARELTRRFPEASLGDAGFSSALIALMLAAWFTDHVRLYAVFGAFLMGMAMPRGAFADRLRAKIEPLTTGLIVPLFFAFSGL